VVSSSHPVHGVERRTFRGCTGGLSSRCQSVLAFHEPTTSPLDLGRSSFMPVAGECALEKRPPPPRSGQGVAGVAGCAL
jgi:hypothetical protein